MLVYKITNNSVVVPANGTFHVLGANAVSYYPVGGMRMFHADAGDTIFDWSIETSTTANLSLGAQRQPNGTLATAAATNVALIELGTFENRTFKPQQTSAQA